MQIQKKIIPFISTFIIIIGLGLLVNLIPQSLISDNIIESVKSIENIDDKVFDNLEQSRINNLSEIYTLETIYYSDSGLKSILLPEYNEIRKDDENYIRTAINMLNINSALDNYPNYAIGQNILLRPLFIRFTMSEIKFFNLEFLIILSVLFVLICEKQKLRPLWISYIISLILTQSFLSTVSLQYMPILLISLITSIIILCTKKEIKSLFIVLGVITAFFDNLGLGIILFSMPQLVSLIKYHSFDEPAHKNTIKHFLEWFISLILTIIIKTSLSYFIYKEFSLTYIKELFTINGSFFTTIGSGLYRNIVQLLPMSLNNPPKANMIIFFVIIFIYMSFLYTYKRKGINKNKIIAYVTIGMLPLINLVLFFGYSYTYNYFMHRILLITIMSMMMIAFECSGFFIKKK